MKKDKRVVAVHKNGLGDYVVSMKIRSQMDVSGIADLVKEMFEQSELYDIVKYNKPYFTVKRIDSSEEISQGYYDEEPEAIPKKFKAYKPLWSTKKTDNEVEEPEKSDKYKEFFIETEKIIQSEHTIEDKLIIILYNIETVIRNIRGSSNIDVYNFIRTVCESIKPNIVEPVKNCRCKESTYNATSSKHHTFPCRSCTEVDEKCIPTDFEGGGCGECPKYEDRVWANILKNKEIKAQFEINKEPEKDRHLTNKELTMWLAQGKGQVQDRRTGRISTNHYYFEYDDSQVDYINIGIRKWGDDKWHEPTYNYCFGEK